jgi:ABC-type sugar transport system ATPase subunit
MLFGITRFPGIVNQAAGMNMLTPRADIDVVTHRMYRNDALGFTILFGLVGAGRSELMKGLFGGSRITSGQLYIDGQAKQADNFTAAYR